MIRYQRILIKLSGEALMGSSAHSFDLNTIQDIITQIKPIYQLGVEIALVVGGGNLFRGINSQKFNLNRPHADNMGMLATVMNGIFLKDALNSEQIASEIYSAFPIGTMVHHYNNDQVIKEITQQKIAILVGGTGSPFFTTDTTAALRAIEINAELLIKLTKVDGIYDSDPLINPQAKKYSHLTHQQAIKQNINIMDNTAFALCGQNNMAINVSSVFNKETLLNVVLGKAEGTMVSADINY